MTDKKISSFEDAFKRLETILDMINEGNLSLEDSLKLFEEADSLILSCSKRLHNAEKRIETLIKNRQNEVALDEMGKPMTAPFTPENEHVIR